MMHLQHLYNKSQINCVCCSLKCKKHNSHISENLSAWLSCRSNTSNDYALELEPRQSDGLEIHFIIKLTKENPVRNQPYISSIKRYVAKTSQIVVSIPTPTQDYKFTAYDKIYFFYFKPMTPNNFPNNYGKITFSTHLKIFEISFEQFNSVARY